MKKALILFGLLITSVNSFASDGDLRISLANCMPDGILNSYRERWNPKEFWIDQNVILEIQLDRRWEYEESIDRCRNIKDSVDKQRCFSYVQSHWQSLAKCQSVTRRMCRANGGYC